MRYKAYIRWQYDGKLIDIVHANTAKECWKLAYSYARYSGETTFQVIDDETDKRYARYFVG